MNNIEVDDIEIGITHKQEEPWTNDIENLVLSWRDHISEMAQLHEEAGIKTKKKHYWFGLPVVLIPFTMTFVQLIFSEISNGQSSQVVKENEKIYNIINGLMFFIISVMSQLYTTFDLGSQSTLHSQYSTRYYDLLIRIDSELSRRRKYRVSADVFITEIRCNIDNLNKSGPSFV